MASTGVGRFACKCTTPSDRDAEYFPHKLPPNYRLLARPYTKTCIRERCIQSALVVRIVQLTSRELQIPLCLEHFEEYQEEDCDTCWRDRKAKTASTAASNTTSASN